MAIVTINIKKECIEQMEMDILGSCVYDCRVFISSMVDSLSKPKFQRQLAASFKTTAIQYYWITMILRRNIPQVDNSIRHRC